MRLMHSQVHQDFEKCKSRIQSLQPTLKVSEERELRLKLKLQDLLRSRKDALERENLEKKITKCKIQIVNESDKLSDEDIDRSLNLKNEDQFGRKLQSMKGN